jgi:hypothetical protein
LRSPQPYGVKATGHAQSSWFLINRTVKFQAMVKPAAYYNEVTTNFEVTSKTVR